MSDLLEESWSPVPLVYNNYREEADTILVEREISPSSPATGRASHAERTAASSNSW